MTDTPENSTRPAPRKPERYRTIPAEFKKSQLGLILKSLCGVLEKSKEEGLEYELTLDAEDVSESDREGAYLQRGTLKLGSCTYAIMLHSYALIPDLQLAKAIVGVPYRRSNLIIVLEEQAGLSEEDTIKGFTFEIYAPHNGKKLCIEDTEKWHILLDIYQDDQPTIGIEQFLYEHIVNPEKPNVRQRIPATHTPAPAYPRKAFVPRLVTK